MMFDAMLPDIIDSAEHSAVQESVGFRTTWTTETSRDPFVELTVASERTTTIGLGTAVSVAFARNPMSMAITANHVHQLSGGRLLLGLGTQVKAHIERRFGMPWSHPAARMREYVVALHAIWRSWNTDEPLNFDGRFYRHSLMPPLFDPGRNPFGTPPVYLAGVGERMATVAGEVAEGFLAPPLATTTYLREVLLPAVSAGRLHAESFTANTGFQTCVMPLVATGEGPVEMDAAIEATRVRLAFYASTPAYRNILKLHGWVAVSDQLGNCARRHEWTEMPKFISDTMLDAFAVVAPPNEVTNTLRDRYGELADRVIMYPVQPWSFDLTAQVLRL